MRTPAIALILGSFTMVAALGIGAAEQPPIGPYQPAWESLKQHKDPEWFRDAKFDLVVRARDAAKWKALNIRSIKLTKAE